MRYWDGIGWTTHSAPASPPISVNNAIGPSTVSVASGPNHALHLILSVFTCGLWLPIWLIVALINPRNVRAVRPGPGLRGFVSAHPVLTVFGVLVAVGATIEAPKVVLGIAISAAIVAGLVGLVMLLVRSVQGRREEIAAIAARADDQHKAVLRGDDQWGVYGQKPPTPPGWDNYAPIVPPSRQWKPDQKWVVAGCAIAAVALLAALITVNDRPADRLSGPMPAPKGTNTPRPMIPRHQGMPAPAPYTPGQLAPLLPIPGIPFPSATVAPNTPTGVPANVGEPAADGQLVFVVTSFDRSTTPANTIVPYLQASAKGIFVNAHVTITNRGTQPAVFFAAEQKLRVNGVEFTVDPVAAVWTLTTAVGLSPGTAVPVTLSFDIPADAPPSGTLELHESSVSRGVDVALRPPN